MPLTSFGHAYAPPTSGPLEVAGQPINGTTEVQTATISGSPTGGTWTLVFEGFETAAIAYNAAASAVQTALQALPSIGSSPAGATVSGSAGGPYTITFGGNLAVKAISTLTLGTNLLTGGTAPSVGIVKATTGVGATHRRAPAGAVIQDTTDGKVYVNASSVSLQPNWVEAPGLNAEVSVSVPILSAAILTLHGTPVTLVPAQGAGTVIVVDAIIGKFTFGTIAYTGANNVEIRYTDGSGVKATADFPADTTFLLATSGTKYINASGIATAFVPVANAPIVAVVPSANPAAGDGVLNFVVKYHVITP